MNEWAATRVAGLRDVPKGEGDIVAGREIPASPIHVGFKLPNCAGVLCEPDWVSPEKILDLARLAQELGYDSIWLHDHLLTPRELGHLSHPAFYEPLVLMTALAGAVSDIIVGVATLIVPLRDPVVLAKQIMTLEHLFPRRVIIGLGVGQYESEFQAFGSDEYRSRGRVADDYLAVMEALFTNDSATVSGAYRSVVEAGFYPKPRSRLEPRIWVGGDSDAAFRRARRFGSGWICTGTVSPEDVNARRQSLGTLLDPFNFAITATVARSDLWTEPGEHSGRIHEHSSVIVGDADEVASRMKAYVSAGVTHFLLTFRSSSLDVLRAQMNWFARDARPLLAKGL